MCAESKLIAIVAHNLHSGGAATASRRLMEAFSSESFEVEAHLIKVTESTNKKPFIPPLRRIYSSLVSRLDHYLCLLTGTDIQCWNSSGLFGQISANEIERNSPDFVNIHWIGHATLSFRQILKIQKPIIITAHDEWWLNAVSHYSNSKVMEEGNYFGRLVTRKLLETKRRILKRSNTGVVCLSSEMKRQFLGRYPFLEGRIIVIPNPVDSDVFTPLPSKENTQASPKLIYLGGFTDKRKGYDLLLEALKKCEERFDLFAAGFTGEAVTGKFEQICIVGIPKVTDETSMNKLFNQADLTVVPSRQEALPQVATESLMVGTPVVSFSVGGLADIVLDGKTGMKVPPFDTSELAKAIDFCIKNDLKKQLPARRFALDKFSRKKIVLDYISFSERLLR